MVFLISLGKSSCLASRRSLVEEELVGPRGELLVNHGVGAFIGVADFDDV